MQKQPSERLINQIVKIFDNYMHSNNKHFLTLTAANKILKQHKIFEKEKLTEDFLKNILVEGIYPHANQTKHSPKQWRIFPSFESPKGKKQHEDEKLVEVDSISPGLQSYHNTEHLIKKEYKGEYSVTVLCPKNQHTVRALVSTEKSTKIRCARCNTIFYYPDKSLTIISVRTPDIEKSPTIDSLDVGSTEIVGGVLKYSYPNISDTR